MTNNRFSNNVNFCISQEDFGTQERGGYSLTLSLSQEDFGTQGRGGYFDQYGIVRDVIQNHLMQGEKSG